MDEAGILASLNFPSIPRFCGQLFYEAKDKELALLCVKAYNDWMIDEWCATDPGRYIPLDDHPAVGPAAGRRGDRAHRRQGRRTRSASPRTSEPLGLPTIHDPTATGTPCWRPCNDDEQVVSRSTSARRRRCPSIADDSPFMANMSLGAVRPGRRHAGLDLQRRLPAVPEHQDRPVRGLDRVDPLLPRAGQAGLRRPALLGRARASATTRGRRGRPRPPLDVDYTRSTSTSDYREHFYGCFIDDATGLRHARRRRRGQRDDRVRLPALRHDVAVLA